MRMVIWKRVFLAFLIVMMCTVTIGNKPAVEAAAKIKYKVTQLSINKGYLHIKGYFYNNGTTGDMVTGAKIRVSLYDKYDHQFWNQTYQFSKVKVWVEPGKRVYHNFEDRRMDYPTVKGKYRWRTRVTLVFG